MLFFLFKKLGIKDFWYTNNIRRLMKKQEEVESLPDNRVAPVLLATALTSLVFPHPGGPYRSTPLDGLIPSLLKASGLLEHSDSIYVKFCIQNRRFIPDTTLLYKV